MFQKRLDQFSSVLGGCLATNSQQKEVCLDEALEMVHFLLVQMRTLQGKAFAIGNGGSASVANHFCTDLIRTLHIAAVPLSDASLLTCFSNDYGYAHAYSEPIKHLFQAEDLLVAVSSSGKSRNIVQAAEMARKKKGGIITFSGFSPDNPLRKLGDVNFWIDSDDYGLVEVGHMFLLHTLVDLWQSYSTKKEHAHMAGCL